jgi:SRSO17 transposase
VLPANAPAWIDRLLTWLEPFESAFGHVAQRGAFRRYLLGLLSDSPRKSMSAMLARVSDPGSYQAFQHFITSAPWAADRLWRQLRRVVPARTGVLILDGTSFPKQGTRSVGVARQYCGTLGKLANCQVAVTAALWTGAQAWLLGARLYLPEEWLTPAQRARAHIGAAVRFQEKWRLALTLVRQIRAARFEITAVLGDAEFGDNTRLRRALHRAGLPYALGISSDLTVFRDTPRLVAPRLRTGGGRRAIRPRLPDGLAPIAVHALAASWPRRQFAARPSMVRPLRRRAGDARPQVAAASDAGGLAARRARYRCHAPHQVLPHSSASHDVAAGVGAVGPPALGH